MAQRFLVFGDHHGDTESLERLLDDTEGERFDFAVHVGDFTDAMREDRATAAEQLRAVEPYLETVADRTRHDLVWVYGNRDYFGDFDYDLDVGTRVPDEGTVTVGGQRFANSPAAVESDVILVTHMETWRLLDHFDGRAHFCGNTHLGRSKGRRVNSAFLQYTHRETGEQSFGGYVVVEVDDAPPFDVDVRRIGTLDRIDCERHGERGVQFHAAFDGCMYCAEPTILMRELAASAFYGLTHDADRDAVADGALVDYAVDLWDDPPDGFRDEFAAYLDDIEDDRYAPLARTEGGNLVVAAESYAY
ncbi:metallophosphoesterase family protein [Halostella salina]|uniref:metallophosphoesterase family protein n=1 Tax=Halostella salina TaxID=1547897 RepID=UPI0013CE6295|nr:metallophosphoesterase [Halostella salina]